VAYHVRAVFYIPGFFIFRVIHPSKVLPAMDISIKGLFNKTKGGGKMLRKTGIAFLTGALVLCCMAFNADAGEKKGEHGGEAAMQMHHLHIMMNHGLAMVTGGSNLVMLAGMKMAPGIDATTLQHGHSMMGNGKGVIRRSLSGPEMMSMMTAEHKAAPLMKYTHNLAETMLEYAEMLEAMGMEGAMKADMMQMHHMHIMINHALEMAAEGSNMKMLGKMGMAGPVDDFSIEHGKMMMNNARNLMAEVMEGKAMKEMHVKGVTPEKGGMMRSTHKLAEKATEIMDLLEKMPAVK
jgi:hypothetical protein